MQGKRLWRDGDLQAHEVREHFVSPDPAVYLDRMSSGLSVREVGSLASGASVGEEGK